MKTMTIAHSKTAVIAIENSQQVKILPVPNTKSDKNKKRLVAQWLVDKNSQLYCHWVTKD
jgi:hypothetical protein